MQGLNSNGRGVIINAPEARASHRKPPERELSPLEIIQIQLDRIRELEAELSQRTVAASTIANVALCLIDRLDTVGHARVDGSVHIPAETERRMRGCQLTVSQNDKTGDVIVRARHKEKPAPVAWEDGRRDG